MHLIRLVICMNRGFEGHIQEGEGMDTIDMFRYYVQETHN